MNVSNFSFPLEVLFHSEFTYFVSSEQEISAPFVEFNLLQVGNS